MDTFFLILNLVLLAVIWAFVEGIHKKLDAIERRLYATFLHAQNADGNASIAAALRQQEADRELWN